METDKILITLPRLFGMSMNKIRLDIMALSHSVTQSHNYAVVLGEEFGKRRLPIVIGGFEAQAIAVALENMTPNRPLTHDLFKNTLETFDINLKEVIINNLLDGIFYAQLVCEQNGMTETIDARTSDAIALAVRYNCPIYTYENILESAGVILEEEETATGKTQKKSSTETLSIAALEAKLKEALEKEEYERAAELRDVINSRKNEES